MVSLGLCSAPRLPSPLSQQHADPPAVALAGAAEEDSLDPVPAGTGVSEFPGGAETVFQPSLHTATTASSGQPHAGTAAQPSNPPWMSVGWRGSWPSGGRSLRTLLPAPAPTAGNGREWASPSGGGVTPAPRVLRNVNFLESDRKRSQPCLFLRI